MFWKRKPLPAILACMRHKNKDWKFYHLLRNWLLLLICMSWTITGQPWNSVLIRRVQPRQTATQLHQGTGFDNARHRLGLATRTQISVCKSPFPSADTAVSLFRAKTVQQRPMPPREAETQPLDCEATHQARTEHQSRPPAMPPSNPDANWPQIQPQRPPGRQSQQWQAKDIRLDWPTAMSDDLLHQAVSGSTLPQGRCWRAMEATGEVQNGGHQRWDAWQSPTAHRPDPCEQSVTRPARRTLRLTKKLSLNCTNKRWTKTHGYKI